MTLRDTDLTVYAFEACGLAHITTRTYCGGTDADTRCGIAFGHSRMLANHRRGFAALVAGLRKEDPLAFRDGVAICGKCLKQDEVPR